MWAWMRVAGSWVGYNRQLAKWLINFDELNDESTYINGWKVSAIGDVWPSLRNSAGPIKRV